jgi:hypothetical protein
MLKREMKTMDLKSQIMLRVETLPVELQRRVLDYCDAVQPPIRGERGESLLSFTGILDDQSASEMSAAIEEACETVDAREW